MTSPLAVQVRKEVREALPWWLSLGGLAVISVSAGWRVAGADRALFLLFGFLGFAAGSVALGANVFGHEYTHRTMTGLLALPVRRSRLLLLKLGVLVTMVALLTLLMFLASRGYTYAEHLWRESGLVIAALAVGVAPCLTLVFRSALAGAAFAAATPLIFLLTGLWIPGWLPSDVEALMRQGSLVVSAVGFVLTCMLFQRLEDLDGPVSDRGVPGWFKRTALRPDALPAAAPRTHHPGVALISKELRLQRMTMLISVLFAAAWLITVFERAVNPQPSHLGVLFPLTAIHGVLVAVMAGALAFAEERQLGSWSMQALLPIRSARQADVKVIVAFSLSMLLAIALPLALNVIAPAPEAIPFDEEQLVGVAAICAGALYVSSASASGIRAVLTMLPFAVLVFITVALVGRVGGMSADLFQSWSSALPRVGWSWRTWRDVTDAVGIALLVGQVAFMLVLAYGNHRTADRSHRRYAMQIVWLVLYALAATVVFAFVGTMANIFARSVT
jgi:hypothetical protein